MSRRGTWSSIRSNRTFRCSGATRTRNTHFRVSKGTRNSIDWIGSNEREHRKGKGNGRPAAFESELTEGNYWRRKASLDELYTCSSIRREIVSHSINQSLFLPVVVIFLWCFPLRFFSIDSLSMWPLVCGWLCCSGCCCCLFRLVVFAVAFFSIRPTVKYLKICWFFWIVLILWLLLFCCCLLLFWCSIVSSAYFIRCLSSNELVILMPPFWSLFVCLCRSLLFRWLTELKTASLPSTFGRCLSFSFLPNP